MKSLVDRFSVEARSPPTFTCAPGPKITPFGLTMKTWPFASSLPKSAEGREPTTRLSAIAFAPG